MSPRRRRTLALRMYALMAALSVAIMAALLVLPRYTRSPRYLEPQAALVQFLVDRWSIKNPKDFEEAVTRVEARVRGKLTLFDAKGHLVRSNVEPPLDAPTDEELDELKTEKWSLDWSRIVVRSDDGSLIGVYAPTRTGFPWSYVLPLGAVILLVVGAASLWFSRRLARPLGELANAARSFGGGNTGARANLDRDDELGDVGRAFDEMAEKTSSVMQAQRQLMGDVSHELRTPLARIRVALELAAEDPVGARDVLSEVGTDLDEIDQLIGDILTTARLDSDAMPINLHLTTLGELSDRAKQKFKQRHPARTLEFTEPEDREIECDPVLLRRALDNLLDNAAKYSDKGAPVTLSVTPNGKTVAFEIVDRGIGMSAEELERAFTPFWRADGSRTRRTGGVGLGLALARRIARVHGGEVTLTSRPGQGTTARLEVPLQGEP